MLVYTESGCKRIIQVSVKHTSYLTPPGLSYVIHRMGKRSKFYWLGENHHRAELPDYKRVITYASHRRLSALLEKMTPSIRITELSIHLEYEA